jgi:prepilin-type processing-associated H-X9-DG protein
MQPFTEDDSVYRGHTAGWAVSKGFRALLLDSEYGVNDSNGWGIFSFHSAGANVALADGSVQFFSDSTDRSLVHAMATKSGGEASNAY